MPRTNAAYRDVDLETLDKIPLPEPDGRVRWAGIQHGKLVRAIRKACDEYGITIANENWQLHIKNQRLYGLLELSFDEEAFTKIAERLNLEGIRFTDYATDKISIAMAVQHSNDSTLALKLIVLLRIPELQNYVTLTRGVISLYRKHTLGIKEEGYLDKLVTNGVGTFMVRAAVARKEVNALRKIKITDPMAHDIMIRAAVEGLVKWQWLKKIRSFWGQEMGKTAWNLYQAFVSPLKNAPINRRIDLAQASYMAVVTPFAIYEDTEEKEPEPKKKKDEPDLIL